MANSSTSKKITGGLVWTFEKELQLSLFPQ